MIDRDPTSTEQAAIKGADLLDPAATHLLDGTITVLRNVRDENGKATGEAAPEAGWKLDVVGRNPEDGVLMAKVSNAEGAYKVVTIDDLVALNPVEATDDPEQTKPRNRVVQQVRNQIGQLEGGEGREVMIPIEAQELGEQAVSNLVEKVEDAEPEHEELHEQAIDIKKVFSSPDNLVDTLHSSETPPELRQQLLEVVGIWKEVQLIDATGTLWQQAIAPKLQDIREVAVKTDRGLAHLTEAADRVRRLLVELEDSVHSRDQRSTDDILQNRGLKRKMTDLDEELHRTTLEPFNQAVMKLDLGSESADEQLRRMKRAEARDITLEDAARLIDEYGDIVMRTGSTDQLRQALHEQADEKGARQPVWRRRKQVIDEVVGFGRRVQNSSPQNFRRISNEMEEVKQMLRRGGRIDTDRLNMLGRGMLGNLTRDSEYISRMIRVVRSYSEEAR